MNARPVHGGRLEEACAHFGGRPAEWLDLSTGINPRPWPGAESIRPDWRALPDPQALARLETAASDYFGGDQTLCCAVPGSEAGLRALGRVLDLPAQVTPLTYGTYAQAFAQPETGNLQPSVRIVANPNNPDGALLSREALIAALGRQEREQGWLIVDEAFADCHPGASVAGHVANGRRLIVTRSFGKFFGLAGVRLGFVIAPKPLLSRLRALQGDWPVCSAAIAFGCGAYADARWIDQTRQALRTDAARLDGVLARHGLQAMGESPLFRLVRTPDASHLFNALAQARILTRPFADYPDLIRFGLPASARHLARLDAALTDWSGRG
jgi:Histidinol-phosphate/aromatic aminotransferase and cobyric acid decarboxylase